MIILILFISLIFPYTTLFRSDCGYHLSRGEELVNSTLGTTAEIIRKKYKIDPCGTSVSMPGGPIQGIGLDVTTRCTYTKEELRELVINCAYELLNQVIINNEM